MSAVMGNFCRPPIPYAGVERYGFVFFFHQSDVRSPVMVRE